MSVSRKRVILSTLATLFDTLGLLSRLVVPAKVLFQDVRLSKLDWDEPLLANELGKWEEWIKSLRQVRTIATPRSMQGGIKGEIIKPSSRDFGDGS